MKFKCMKSLYWHQTPGYSGMLSAEPVMGQTDETKMAFEEGREYEMFPYIDQRSFGIERVYIYAVGENGQIYKILNTELHFGDSSIARRHFDFSRAVR